MAKAAKKDSEALVKYTGFTNEELKGLQSFEDIEALFRSRGEEIHSAADEMGDGFTLLDNKDILVNTPLMVVSWVFAQGDYKNPVTGEPGEFVSARMMCRMENGTVGKFIVNDGGTGICKQLKEYSESHNADGGAPKQGGLYVPKGLVKSEYSNEYTDEGVTYYLSTSA